MPKAPFHRLPFDPTVAACALPDVADIEALQP